MKPSWLTSALLLVAIMGSSCISKGDVSVGQGLQPPSAESPTPAIEGGSEPGTFGDSANEGSFIIRLQDQSSRNPAGIPIEVRGPVEGIFPTDDNGQIQVFGPAGHYTYRVGVGCYDEIEVTGAVSGRTRISGDDPIVEEASIEWFTRISPATPVFATVVGDWIPGEQVRLRFDVIDRCIAGGARQPGADFSPWIYQVGRNIQIHGEPSKKADKSGYGWVTVSCKREGEAEVSIVDSNNPANRLDLLRSGQGTSETECRNLE